jgi:hypothetical protein
MQRLNSLLIPMAAHQYEAQRQDDLTRVCKKAAQLGRVLLSQPAEWMFDWASPADRSTLVIAPALVKLTDESGRLIEPARVVLQAKTVRLSG